MSSCKLSRWATLFEPGATMFHVPGERPNDPSAELLSSPQPVQRVLTRVTACSVFALHVQENEA